MTDLLHIIPAFPTQTFTHLLPSLERNLITTTDLVTLDAVEIAKRAQLPVLDIRRLASTVVTLLRQDLEACNVGVKDVKREEEREGHQQRNGFELVQRWSLISTLDSTLDTALNGGIPTGYVTEITGESGAGKTQFLLTLLLAAQLPSPHGLARPSLYISTEAPLSTQRLTQLLTRHPRLTSLPPGIPSPTLSNILSISVPDLESQDHILQYQLPVAIRRHKVGLVVLDSVAANYRAEYGRSGSRGDGATFARRSASLVRLGSLLRDLARTEDVAVVVANQVADRFAPPPPPSFSTSSPIGSHRAPPSSPFPHSTPTPSSQPLSSTLPTPLTLDHQQRWYTGWGNAPYTSSSHNANAKTPSLGHVWSLQISARIALIKTARNRGHVPELDRIAQPLSSPGQVRSAVDMSSQAKTKEDRSGVDHVPSSGWKRKMDVVFAPWTKGVGRSGDGVEFEISSAGVKGVGYVSDDGGDGGGGGGGGGGDDKRET
ncbi:MAG: hypothetical protein M1838_001818 [Thelocarpon superellum]|nr:MAG: hypothetical protein M1838_001818 [Thelocarpon superellum]